VDCKRTAHSRKVGSSTRKPSRSVQYSERRDVGTHKRAPKSQGSERVCEENAGTRIRTNTTTTKNERETGVTTNKVHTMYTTSVLNNKKKKKEN
jgi:hypothetical protein